MTRRGLVLIEGLQDSWAQSAYSSMPHLGQSAPFAAINPQDRLVSFSHHSPSLLSACVMLINVGLAAIILTAVIYSNIKYEKTKSVLHA